MTSSNTSLNVAPIQSTSMQVASATQVTLSSESEKKIVSSESKVSNSKHIFYPKAKGVYQCDVVNNQQLRFRAKNEDALFYSITLHKEDGRGISIKSNFIKDMDEFLSQNNIPIKEEWGSDCQYYQNEFLGSNSYAQYYTFDLEVCQKLTDILLQMNQFDFAGISKDQLKPFLGDLVASDKKDLLDVD